MHVAFSCHDCGQMAGRVELLLPGERISDRSRPALEMLATLDPILRPHADNVASLMVESFCGTESLPVNGERLDVVGQAIRAGDAAALYRLAYSYAPFHCPECALCYCGEHWQWHHFVDERHDIDGIEGNCPHGHFHVLVMGQ